MESDSFQFTQMLTRHFIRNSSTYSNLPQGFTYIPNFITQQQAQSLKEIVNSHHWCNHLRRQQQYYGIKYFQTKYSDSYLQNIESIGHYSIAELDFMIQKIKKEIDVFGDGSPNQVLVNKYTRKDYLGLHVEDTEAFGDIIMGLSIGDFDYLRLAPAIPQQQWKQTPKQHLLKGVSQNQIKVKLENKSLYILKNEARFGWRHGIGRSHNGKNFKGQNFERISFTFRDVLESRRKIIQKKAHPLHKN